MAFSFGSAAAPSSGFSFGSTPATSSGFNFGGAPSVSSGFSFGGTSSAPAASSGFNFGAPAASASPSPSLFGVSTSTPSTGFGFGNYGTTMPQPAATPGFGFGSTAVQSAAPVGPPITLETVFEALPDEVKKNMTHFYAFLKEQEQTDAFLKTVSPRPMEVLRENIARLEQQVLTRRNRQDRQTAAVQQVRQNVRQLLHQVDAATLTRRSLDTSAGGTSTLYHVMRQVEMPSPYYWELLDHYEHKMAGLKAQIEDVEAQFKPFADGQGGAATSPAPLQLQQILLAQNAALMQVAARVADVHEKAEELRQLFLTKIRDDLARHGEKSSTGFQNPFDKRKKSSEVDKRQAIDTFRFRTSVAPTIVTSQPPPAAVTGFGFGTPATPAAPPSGFHFGTSAPAKTVSFDLNTSASSVPAATTTSVSATPVATGGFTAPTVATSGFSTTSSSFPPVIDTANSGKRSGRVRKMRK